MFGSDGVDTDWFGVAWEYTGHTGSAPTPMTFMSALTPVVTHVTPARGMQGQLISIHGYNLKNTMPVTDSNWYMTEFGFYEQSGLNTAKIDVGSYQCQLFSHNDTLIQCHVVYGDMYKQLGVAVSVHGSGNAKCSASYTFALDVIDISPPSGSLAGGTTLTIETTKLHDEVAGLGVSSFDIWLMEDIRYGISKYIAEYLGVDQGIGCDLVATAQTSDTLTCVTREVGSSVWTEPLSFDDEALEVFLLAEWNFDEIYNECPYNCTFEYMPKMTPVLTLDTNASTLLLGNQSKFQDASDNALAAATGDVLVLVRDTTDDVFAGKAFNWSAVSSADVAVALNNVSLPFELSITEIEGGGGIISHWVELKATISAEVPPCLSESLVVKVEPFGYGVVLNGDVSILPVVSTVSHYFGSDSGGLDVTITGQGIGFVESETHEVTVGGRPCSDVRSPNATTVICTTSPEDENGENNNGYGIVSVVIADVASVCTATPSTKLVTSSYFNATSNTTSFMNKTKVLHEACEFRFHTNVSHTPEFVAVSTSRGHWPDVVTITGAGFAESGNAVTMGYRSVTTVSENSTHLVVRVPKHVGGTYPLSVSVPDKGYAAGPKMWFRFETGIESITPKLGSRYGGQRITITGYGFAPHGDGFVSGSSSDDALAYLELFGSWVNYGSANETVPFNFETARASFDTIVGVTHFKNQRSLDGDFSSDWMTSLSVDVAKEDEGYVGPSTYAYVTASDSDSNVELLFDGAQYGSGAYDGYPGGVNLQIFYAAYEPFILTDYQLLWRYKSNECPSKWRIYGKETSGSVWELVDTMDGPRTESASYKFINRTVDSPGFYQFYLWQFLEWAPSNGGGSTSDGHQMREIVLNPNGFAMHYGSAFEVTVDVDYKVGLGLTNVAFGKPAFQVKINPSLILLSIFLHCSAFLIPHPSVSIAEHLG